MVDLLVDQIEFADVVVINKDLDVAPERLEIACFGPGCPEAETAILLMRTGHPTQALKVASRMADVTDAAIQDAGLLQHGGVHRSG